ncbi:hypothetical protein LJR129_005155 [Acidovorax sp. LjRoot129]|uniref:hypothetical protein n=1 Tax=Acidovorax sp. LjRoot129 TaxID=3342260 RepID=UPI003ED06ED2
MTGTPIKDPREALEALAKSSEKKSKAALFRLHRPQIEAAQTAGVAQSEIVRVLNEHGFDITLGMLRNYLHRERKKATGTKKEFPREQAKTAQEGNDVDQMPEMPISGKTTDPSAIDKIVSSKPDLAALAKIHLNQRK